MGSFQLTITPLPPPGSALLLCRLESEGVGSVDRRVGIPLQLYRQRIKSLILSHFPISAILFQAPESCEENEINAYLY